MSFLTPLYLLGGLAIGLPILFHLIRRTPKGRQVFSSLMFLEPSPPKVTKRSRIEDWLLLVLRGLVVCLLALAFARPFLRTQDRLDRDEQPGRRVAILIDTSASMQRDGLWEQAKQAVEKSLGDLKPSDTLSLSSFDADLNSLISFSEWLELEPDSRLGAARELVGQLAPTYRETHLGKAMIQAVDLLEEHADDRIAERLLIVVSDFQSGSHWEELNGYEWPDGVTLHLRRIDDQENTTNASIQWVANESTTDDAIRVRVSNSDLAKSEQFEVSWVDEYSEVENVSDQTSVKVYVPPGQSKVIRTPQRPTEAMPQRLVLTGDEFNFDNVCYIARREPWDVQILFAGDETQTGPDSLRFFLDPVFPSTATRKVTISNWLASEPSPPIESAKLTLLVIGGTLVESQLTWTREWVRSGGPVLFVATSNEQSSQLHEIVDSQPITVQEADVIDYAMLGRMNLDHPILAPFDDPRFADFSKLRFWKHRDFEIRTLKDASVLAAFDDGSPALFEVRGETSEGKAGRVLVFASGWNRSDSELAVWSKFVPLMNGLLEYLGEQKTFRPSHEIGTRISPSEFGFTESQLTMKTPDGTVTTISNDEPFELVRPGIYVLATGESELLQENAVRFAVNLPAAESKTTPLSEDLLEAAGVIIADASMTTDSATAAAEQSRQLMNRELESRQQLWKWILAAALIILLLETALAGVRQRTRALPVAS